MGFLYAVGDILWIVALSIMAGGSRNAARHIAADARVPLLITEKSQPALRLSRNLALSVGPLWALAIGMILLWAVGLFADNGPDAALALFGLRATAAAVLALMHLRWIAAVTALMGAEGKLKS